MKKLAVLLLVTLIALTGCKKPVSQIPPTATPVNVFSPENEIVTYTRVDNTKTQLLVATVGNAYIDSLVQGFEKANPDVQVIVIDITGGNAKYSPSETWLSSGLIPDVMFIPLGQYSNDYMKTAFTDLSGMECVTRYQTETLGRISIDGHLYALPGASQMSCLLYNKTMFEQYNWEIPQTFDEFVALCTQITADTNGSVTPWNPNAKYEGTLVPAMFGFTYAEILAGVDNRTWYNEFLAGNATFAEHMRPFYDAWKKLVDAGIVNEDFFTYSATTRGNDFLEGKLAMYNAIPVAAFNNASFEQDYMPYPGARVGDSYVIDTVARCVSVPINSKRTEAVTDAANRFLDYYSTPEGQTLYIGADFAVSNLIGVESDIYNSMASLHDCINNGRVFTQAGFKSDRMSPQFSPYSLMRAHMLEICKGTMTVDEALHDFDTKAAATETEMPKDETLCTVSEDFTVLETSCLYADMFREKTSADIGLIVHGTAFRGNLMRIFKGNITQSMVTVFKPRQYENGSTLVKLSMTGKQLIDALNAPGGAENLADAVYAVSGLKCTLAPWNAVGSKVVSVTLADGTAIDENKLYTVGCWQGTIGEEFITETLETFEGTWEELFAQMITARGTLSPVRDGRITLVWE